MKHLLVIKKVRLPRPQIRWTWITLVLSAITENSLAGVNSCGTIRNMFPHSICNRFSRGAMRRTSRKEREEGKWSLSHARLDKNQFDVHYLFLV